MSNRMRPKGRVQPARGSRNPGYATGKSRVPRDMAKLSEKKPGAHRWAAIAHHEVTDDQARAFAQGSAISLDGSKMIEMVIGCCDCMVDFSAAAGTECEGSP